MDENSPVAAARKAGTAAWIKGDPLICNPFDFDREHDEWGAWRGAWIRASEDHLESLQSR